MPPVRLNGMSSVWPTNVPACGPASLTFTSPDIAVVAAFESLTVQFRLTTALPADASTRLWLQVRPVKASLPLSALADDAVISAVPALDTATNAQAIRIPPGN